MKAAVTVIGDLGTAPQTVMLQEAQYQEVIVTSRYLISAGQSKVIGLVLHNPMKIATHSLIDGTKQAGIVIPRCWDVSYVPTQRPLQDILSDVVAHGVSHTTHGIDCVCMDALIREVRVQVSRAIPPDTADVNDIHERLHARARMRHILRVVMEAL